MLEIAIPGAEPLRLTHLVVDFNGTLAAQIVLIVARNALAVLRPKSLHGYGEVATKDALAIETLLAEVEAILRQMDACLAPQVDLRARLARLGSATREAAPFSG